MNVAIRPCSNCGDENPPAENGQCAKCRAFRHGHVLSRKHPLDERDLRFRTEQVMREHRVDRDTAEEYAAVVLTLKKVRKGSAEHQRLLTARRDLRLELEASRAGPADSLEDLSDDELIALAVSILKRLLATRDGAVATPVVEEAHALLAQAASNGS